MKNVTPPPGKCAAPGRPLTFTCNIFRSTDPPRSAYPAATAAAPEVLYVNERAVRRRPPPTRDTCTQTSKTILQLAAAAAPPPPPRLSDLTLDGSCHEARPLTAAFLRRARLQSRSFVDGRPHRRPRSGSLELPDNSREVRKKSASFCKVMGSTFMCPTAASQIKSKMEEVRSANFLIPPMRRGRSTSPKPTVPRRRMEAAARRIPYIDQSRSELSSSTTIINTNRHPDRLRMLELGDEGSFGMSEDEEPLSANLNQSNSSVDTSICVAVNKFREPDWRVALRGLSEIVELCRVVELDLIYDYMASINQRLIELLKSPRSHVCRTACQAAGHLFEYVKDTRRPEFDDIVDLLLHKTADANKFIRHDANLALDCMVTHISSFNAVRSLCHKGPVHKNHLVRTATVRLLVCVVVLAGPEFILNPNNNEYTRKRIILNLARFLEDKNLETRKLAERLYKVLCKEPRFDVYLKKYLEKEQITKIKKTLKLIHKK